MRIEYLADGSPRPIYEVGDFVRFVRDEEGPIVTARAGEWGEVMRVQGARIDIRLAGYCRPRTTDLPMARDVPRHCVSPCDRGGTPLQMGREIGRRRS